MPGFAHIVAAASIALIATASTAADQNEGSRLAKLLAGDPAAGFARALEPRAFDFPHDHGPHPEYRNEWWYFTGNLEDASGRRFGYELTFFRVALGTEPPRSDSAWRSNQVYMAHFAVTDASSERFYVAERFSRAALGLAGAARDPFAVWIDNWSIRERPPGSFAESSPERERWTLSAADDRIALKLDLAALKPPALNGSDGLSRKSADPGNASYYYSISRWQSSGMLSIGAETYAVTGHSWLDREWSTSALADEQVGWDWFALQLSDGTDIMFYNLRNTDGSQDAHSAGTWIGPDGTATSIRPGEIDIAATGTWESPSGGRYPSGWELRVPGRELAVTVAPVIDNQELRTLVRYWEGAVDVRGRLGDIAVTGRGYVELTGYADTPSSAE